MSALASGAFGALSLRQRCLLLLSVLEVLIFSGSELQFTVEDNRTIQRQGHGVLVDGIAVFAVIQQRHPKVVLRQVGPLVTPHLMMDNKHSYLCYVTDTYTCVLKHRTEV